jgi:hypothetical protein
MLSGPQFSWVFGASPSSVRRIGGLPLLGLGVVLFGIFFFGINAILPFDTGLGVWIEAAVAAVLGLGASFFGLHWYHARFDVKDD